MALFRLLNKKWVTEGLRLITTASAAGAPSTPPPPPPQFILSPAIHAAGHSKWNPSKPTMTQITEQAILDSVEPKYFCIYCECLYTTAQKVKEHDCSQLTSKQQKGYNCVHEECGNRFKHPAAAIDHEANCDGFGCHKDYPRGRIVEGNIVKGYPLIKYKRSGPFSGKEILFITDYNA